MPSSAREPVDTRHLVDPELLPLLDVFPELVLTDDTLPTIRAGSSQLMQANPPMEFPGVATTLHTIDLESGPSIRVEVSCPVGATDGSSPRGAVLWIHGGGFVLGSAIHDRSRCELMASELNAVVVSVDYELAPQAHHTQLVEQCYQTLRWTFDNAGELGVDPDRLAVAGESAGGVLAAGVALICRDRGQIRLRYQWLIYPMLDDRTTITPQANPLTGQFIWTRASNRFGWTALLGADLGAADVPGYCAPARAVDLAGLAPAFISVGALDLFLDEDIYYAHRLLRAGVAVDLAVYAGAFHGFTLAATTRVACEHWRAGMTALSRALAVGGSG